MKRSAFRGRSGHTGQIFLKDFGVLFPFLLSAEVSKLCVFLCCKIKHSKWLPKTIKIAEKLIMRPKFYKRTSVITNFGPNLRNKSTIFFLFLLSNGLVMIFAI